MEQNFKEILKAIGEDPSREGLLRTPHRAAKAIEFLTSGYKMDPREILNNAVFKEDYDQMVTVKDIEFHSLCEHHVLPFWGLAHVAYLPNGHVIGLSKIPRIVDIFSRRLQVQERLTEQIADCLVDLLNPLGVAVVIQGRHTCASMRGVQKQNSYMITSAMRGIFRDKFEPRAEFLGMIGDLK